LLKIIKKSGTEIAVAIKISTGERHFAGKFGFFDVQKTNKSINKIAPINKK
jgi:hypothetical protein